MIVTNKTQSRQSIRRDPVFKYVKMIRGSTATLKKTRTKNPKRVRTTSRAVLRS